MTVKNAYTDFSIVKFKLVELAISDIGMGMYQWQLFGLCGIGWAADK